MKAKEQYLKKNGKDPHSIKQEAVGKKNMSRSDIYILIKRRVSYLCLEKEGMVKAFQLENSLNEKKRKTQTMTELRMVGDEFCVDYVTEILGIQPTEVWRKGESIRTTGKKYTYTAWEYSTGYKEISDVGLSLIHI